MVYNRCHGQRKRFDDLPTNLQQHLQENECIGVHSLMHSRKKAAPKDSPWLKDIDPDDCSFGRHMLLQVHAGNGCGNLYITNHMHHLDYRTPRSCDFNPSAWQPFKRVPEPQSSELIEGLLAYAT